MINICRSTKGAATVIYGDGRQAQKELGLEEKQMKLKQENDQHKEAFIMQMIQIFAKCIDTKTLVLQR